MRPKNLDRYADRAFEAFSAPERLWFSFPVGAGRRSVADSIIARDPSVLRVDLLDPKEPDGAVGALLALHIDAELRIDREQLGDLRRFEENCRSLVKRLNELDRRVLILVPSSWGRPALHFGDGDNAVYALSTALFGALGRIGNAVWLAESPVDPTRLGVSPDQREVANPHLVEFDPDETDWGHYVGYAKQLAESLSGKVSTSPLVWRAAVGSIALGERPSRIARMCETSPSYTAVSTLLRTLGELIGRGSDGVQIAVRRFLQARRPLPRETALSLSGVAEEHQALLSECLGYGNPVHTPTTLRARLLALLPSSKKDLEDSHLSLSEYYRKMDGAQDPGDISTRGQMRAWVERAHHLAHAGPGGASEWGKLEHPTPTFFWDRARSLSKEHGAFEEAAEVYRQCLALFPEDDYSHEYLAWNLRKAKIESSDICEHYREAVRLKPKNPWWNSRWIEFLIESGRYDEARAAWQKALNAIDPTGTATDDPWLVAHLHYWVARAWAISKQFRDYHRVVDGISEDVLEEADRFPKRDFTGLCERIRSWEKEEVEGFIAWVDKQSGSEWTHAKAIWSELRGRLPSLSVPAATEGADGGAQLVWSTPTYYVEVEVLPDKRFYWYARLREKGQSEGTEEPVGDLDEVLEWLERVAYA